MVTEFMKCEKCGWSVKHVRCMPGWQCEECGNVISRNAGATADLSDVNLFDTLEPKPLAKKKSKKLELESDLVLEKMLCGAAHIEGFGPFKHLCSEYRSCQECQLTKHGYAYKWALRLKEKYSKEFEKEWRRDHPKKFDEEYKKKLGSYEYEVIVIAAILFSIVYWGTIVLWRF